jgi:hypothetical protein
MYRWIGWWALLPAAGFWLIVAVVIALVTSAVKSARQPPAQPPEANGGD